MPFVALRVILREILPLRQWFKHFETGVAGQSTKTIREKSPAINREPMLGSTRGRDDATEALRLKNQGDFAHRLPKEFNVLESLAGNDHIDTGRVELLPVVGIAQNQIDIFSRRQIDTGVSPGRFGKEWTV